MPQPPVGVDIIGDRETSAQAMWKGGREMTETDKAWLAGLFDGEGCVWSRWPKRMNVITEIKMCHMGTIERVNSLFPGRVAKGHLSGWSIKPQWRWSLDTLGTQRFLTMIRPYLVTKRREAEIALELCNRKDGTCRFDILAAELKACR